MKELTRAEEQIMHVLWALQKAYVRDIIERLPSPKPAYNTVSTIVRILEKKGFVDHEAFGKTHLYRPIIAKEDYTQAFLRHFVRDYFDDSYQELVSFFARDRSLTVSELEEILTALREEIKKQKA
ncbi:MAG TPA: BlaI/MecI/CopY family transcriptional regulator [Candidatus Aminicenantes bacterium]|nr:BlaI/MecI/CopY family transcriptional regulator [Candidatus Aminicenantes bacterium]HRY64499.1 BlaI/MecI/CopY family transcriptional regulator [Candidatus Aminicenantes bacterium]HRZ71412.1 BlaI/MecI/CopY family transcriptional regulator [Candidatus Aminicenantes bacterium]